MNDNQYTDTKTEILPATGHNYENPEWNWSWSWGSGWSATARLTCENDKTHSKIAQATVTTKKVDATCDTDGSDIRIATVKVNGKTFTTTESDVIYSTGHSYGEPKWTWNGYDSATATFTCKNDDSHVQTVESVIKKKKTEPTCENKGSIVYTATVEFNDNQYTDTKTEILPATGHDYENPEWNWSYSWQSGWSATARLTCENDKTHSKIVQATVTTKKVDATCDMDGSNIRIATVKVSGKTFTTTESDVIYSTGHSYGEPEWTWNDYSSAVATFTCENDDSHIETSDAAIKTQTTLPTCESNGKVVYTATVKFNGNTYNDSRTENLDALGHSYNISNWNWDGYEKAIATLICENDKSHTKLIKAEVKSEKIDDRQTIYTATVLVDGIAYTNEKIKTEDYLIGIIGDMDGDGKITSADSLLILRQSVSLENFTDEQLLLADVDGDDSITSADALEVLRFSVGLPTRGNIGNEMIE